MAGYRRPYTLEEQKRILNYIIKKKEFHSLRGRYFWQEMEQQGVVNRTWQSVKEHFIKQLLPRLTDPKFALTEENISSLRDGFRETSQSARKPLSPRQNKCGSNQPAAKAPANVSDLAVLLDSSDEET